MKCNELISLVASTPPRPVRTQRRGRGGERAPTHSRKISLFFNRLFQQFIWCTVKLIENSIFKKGSPLKIRNRNLFICLENLICCIRRYVLFHRREVLITSFINHTSSLMNLIQSYCANQLLSTKIDNVNANYTLQWRSSVSVLRYDSYCDAIFCFIVVLKSICKVTQRKIKRLWIKKGISKNSFFCLGNVNNSCNNNMSVHL